MSFLDARRGGHRTNASASEALRAAASAAVASVAIAAALGGRRGASELSPEHKAFSFSNECRLQKSKYPNITYEL